MCLFLHKAETICVSADKTHKNLSDSQDRKMLIGYFLQWNVDDCCTCDTTTHGFHFSVYPQEQNSDCS